MSELWPFVGRDGEIAAIVAAVSADRPTGWILTGAAGVGKSRLLRQLTTGLDPERFVVFSVAGTEATSGIPLGAFADLLPPAITALAGAPQLLRDTMEHLRIIAGPRRAVLAVDDLHLLNALDATLLYYAARNGSATVLATRRAGAPVADVAEGLWKEDLVRRVELPAFGLASTGEVLGAALQGPVERSTVARMWQLTEGNALMLREVVTALAGTPELFQEEGLWRWTGRLPRSPDLTSLILGRVGDLDSAVGHALELVTFGEGIGLALLTAATSVGAVEQAESLNLIQLERSGRRTAVRLAHPLHGEAIRQVVPSLRATARRAELIRAVRETGARRRNDLLQLALWSLDNGDASDPELMLAAARMAYADFDMRLAARLAVAAGGSVDAVELLSYALAYAGDPEHAIDVTQKAALGSGNGWDRARLLSARDTHAFAALGDTTILSDHPAARLGVTDPDAATWVGDQELIRRLWSGQFQHARRTLAGRLPAPPEAPSWLLLQLVAACLEAYEGRYQAALERTEHLASRDNAAVTLPYLQVALTFLRSTAALISGDLALLHADLDAFERMGSARYFPINDGQLAVAQATVLRLAGHSVRAADGARDAVASLTKAGMLYRPLALAELAHNAALTGDVAAAQTWIAAAAEALIPNNAMLYPWVELARIQVASSAGRLAVAQDLAVHLARRVADDGMPAYEVHAWHALVRHAAPTPEAVARLIALAAAVAGPFPAAAAGHAKAVSEGDPEAILAAADGYTRLGMHLYAAEAAAQAYTTAHRQGTVPGPVLARLVELLDRCDAICTPALDLPLPDLTEREYEIADLAAAGLTSPQIAHRLFLSPRTPDSHLQRIYAKLGITGRAQLPSMLRLCRTLSDRRRSL